MTRNKSLAPFLAAALALCGLAMAGFAPRASADGSPSQKIVKTHYIVVRMSAQLIQVRSESNERELHSFTYGPDVRDKMISILNAGGYRYGDKVTIWHKDGDDVAVKITGKPSKAK
jgi:hypothetical protein